MLWLCFVVSGFCEDCFQICKDGESEESHVGEVGDD